MNMRLLVILAGLGVVAASGTANATLITIQNPSFELPPLAGPGSFTLGSIVDWNLNGVGGIFQPANGQLAPPTDGVQVGYLTSGDVSQTLAATLTAGLVYTLDADFLARENCCGWAGSELDLVAGSTVLASAFIPTLSSGGVQTSTVSYAPTALDPNLGQTLEIVITATGGTGAQIDFDNVTLDASSSVPEPATGLFVGTGLMIAALATKRRGKRTRQ